MQDLVIIGARAHARQMHDAVISRNEQTPTWNFLGFIADEEPQSDLIAERGVPVLGDLEVLKTLDPVKTEYVIGRGDPKLRKKLDDLISPLGFRGARVIHPSAVVGTLTTLGEGCYIAALAVVTTNVTLGRHTHINLQASISHDDVLGDYCMVNPGSHVAGRVTFGEGVYTGVGANFRPEVTIGDWAVIGAGAAVVSDVPANVTYVGVPAHELVRK